MNTTKKIVVALAVMMVAAALAAPAAIAIDPYTATVDPGQNTAVAVGTGGVALSSGLAGETLSITDSLKLTNEGNADCAVSAAFTTSEGSTYGLTGTSPNVIPGTSFSLGKTGKLVALDATATPKSLTPDNNVPKGTAGTPGTADYDAQLDIPAGQAADAYTGTVELSFA